ncbi:TPA: hypothetical protein WGW93_000887 [Neisseria meningitidis]|jgi:uncharacterized 6.4 kDa protein in sieA-mnt intergenic region|uniref:YjzC family protein n=2 Tax=Neisseria meningitidis TaxID=487 RepID=A0A9K2KNE2_NEIM8|nr:hypothetical protein [Neisseria meningitidis]CAX50262.1 conserved hypothetical protein [Neisseria meningitidis 8013]MBG9188449.1 hypothetical protein [Neisseria meningitidis]MBG9192711.1 hypothetical protein [Neisseria meningitidis]MBH2277003.1 hypothetical protein [Neisseria meningitidis]
MEMIMTNKIKPGQNTGNNGGIYQEIGSRGGRKDNYATIKDNQKAPPTQNPGSSWIQIKRTPDSSR